MCFIVAYGLASVCVAHPWQNAKTKVNARWGEVFLSSSSCEDLKRTLRDVMAWKTARHEELPAFSGVECHALPPDGVEISPLLPNFVRKLHGFSLRSGIWETPNCWNCALCETGVESEIKYTSDLEFFIKTKSEFEILPVVDLDAIPPGSMIAIRYLPTSRLATGFDQFEGACEAHAFTWINSDICFSKNGTGPYSIQSTIDVLERYGVFNYSPECINPDLEDHPLPEKCGGTFIKVFKRKQV